VLNLFRSIHPGALLAVLLYSGLINLGQIISVRAIEITNPTPISKALFELFEFQNSGAWMLGIGIFLTFVQALLVNNMANNFKLLKQQTYIPAIIFLLFSGLYFNFSSLNPVMIANLFIILILMRLLKVYKKDRIEVEAFDIGFLIALASLFYFPSIALILFMLIGLSLFRPFNLREWLIGFVGLGVPYLLVSTYYFWNEGLTVFLGEQFGFNFASWDLSVFVNIENVIKAVLLLLLVFWAILVLQGNFLRRSIQHRKFSVLLIWLLIIAAFSFILQREQQLNHFLLAIIPTSMLIAYVLSESKKRILAELAHLLLLGIVFYYQYKFLLI